MFYHRRHHPVAGAMVAGAVAGAVATAVVAVHHPVAAVVHHTTHSLSVYFFRIQKRIKQNRAMDGPALLERLPRELVWMIIDYVPESFFQLGDTSKMLRSQTHAYSLEPVKIKLVKQITFDFSVRNFRKSQGIDTFIQNENVEVLMRENTTR
ncbi:hypothetical protein PRIPAC_79244 [Pristionchus pacificus]|uniref:Uncharacterized protein n=1 Tax=Pristionchus pacificus TaxID=54126 RepID=A0A2A6BH30_PRIPA|nr:hypothetical protein PRIPAC_79244 [Pristionchus pacificus]|eukprot:PDM65187.1 hypothetical protein PRIPAC_52129 [Pristionchus pacificus]